jgi:alpha-amylase
LNRLQLIIVIHNHQPVGNFDHVVEEAYERSYRPFLEVLERRPELRIGLHNSGCLWEWLEHHHPDYGDRVGRLVERGQVELLGGGFYEPILPLLPARDRRGQLERMGRFLEGRFGVRPKGIWLAERVWEPHLAGDLALEGIEYLCLDDTQFIQMGLRDEELKGSYRTEDSGLAVTLYPIQMLLRYQIPFAPPETVIETLRASADEQEGTMRLFGDDGEKFGVWPGTYHLCYEEHWIDRFLDHALREEGWLTLTLPGEHLRRHGPRGRVYLPPGSYREMTEWALPLEARMLYEETQHALIEQGRGEAERVLLRGGFFRNFLSRYSESNRMNKRVQRAHARLDAAKGIPRKKVAEIRDHLWRAQCNCAYWHGIFGGLYLPHLREGIYRELLQGEAQFERSVHGTGSWVEASREDFDLDGVEEVILTSDKLALILSPLSGGGLIAIDDRANARNLVNPLTRRREAYHAQIGRDAPSGDGAVRTIHDLVLSKEEHLERFLIYDRWERVALVDRFFRAAPGPLDLVDGGRTERGDFAGARYRIEEVIRDASVGARLAREGRLDGDDRRRVSVEKKILLAPGVDGFDVEYRLRSLGSEPLSFHFGVEWLINMLAGRAPDRFVLIDGRRPDDPALAAAGDHPGARRISLVDAWLGERVDIEASGADGWVRNALETVSLSESGAERIYQGTIAMPHWRRTLAPGEEVSLSMRFTLLRGESVGEA